MHYLIPSQLSSHIVQNYPDFVAFLKAYFEWLQKPDSPYGAISRHMSAFNLDESLDAYEQALKLELFPSLPDHVKHNRALLLRHSREFFRTVGTETAFKFIFKVVYGEDIDFFYPRDFLLIPSNGKWVDDEIQMIVTNRNQLSFDYKQITQVQPGNVIVTAKVAKASTSLTNGFRYVDLHLTEVSGTFNPSYEIVVDGKAEFILPIASTFSITSGGMGYSVGDPLTYVGANMLANSVGAGVAGRVDTKYPTILSPSQLTVHRNGAVLTGFQYDGVILTHDDIAAGDVITVFYPVAKGSLVVGEVNNLGTVTKVNVVDTPFWLPSGAYYTGNAGGSGASVSVTTNTTRIIDGAYINTDGFLSDKDVLQDSMAYQEFSYVIKSGVPRAVYKPVIDATCHPAGFNMASEVAFIDTLDLTQDLTLFTVTLNNTFGVQTDMSSVDALYSTYGYIDDMKFTLGAAHYKSEHFMNVIVGDIINTPYNHYNFCDTKIDITVGGVTTYEKDLDAGPLPSAVEYGMPGYYAEGYVTVIL